jgi:hypothetical protein
VSLAAESGGDSAAARFGALDTALSARLSDSATAVGDRLGALRPALWLDTLVDIVAGLVAAVAVWLGFAQRIEEYR